MSGKEAQNLGLGVYASIRTKMTTKLMKEVDDLRK
jgi:hypothetical protein